MHCKSFIEILSQVSATVKERKKQQTNKQKKKKEEKKTLNKFDSSKYYSNKVMYTKKTCTYM